jgi:pilus assembly protein CpaF
VNLGVRWKNFGKEWDNEGGFGLFTFPLQEISKKVKDEVKEILETKSQFTDDEVYQIIVDVLLALDQEFYTKPSEKVEVLEGIFNSMRRLDVLQPLIEDKSITEIMVNGHQNIFIEKDGRVFRADVQFESEDKLRDVISQIVSEVNRAVNEANPMVDARLKDGSRVNAVIPPVSLGGSVLTIRKFPEKPMTVSQLIRYNSITKEVADFLEKLVRAKYNIFVCGGTGSGKTTFLNALSNFIPKNERVITIEDSAELQIVNIENIVALETRNANTEGKGEVSVRDLIKSSLRMRPERIVVGEVRGAEALDMLQAMNTGHDGSLSTGHANSTKDMLSRLETMVLSGAGALPLEAVRQQIASGIDIFIHLARFRDRSRRTTEIVEVLGYREGEIALNPLYQFEEEGEDDHKRVLGRLKRTQNDMVHTDKLRMAGIPDDAKGEKD